MHQDLLQVLKEETRVSPLSFDMRSECAINQISESNYETFKSYLMHRISTKETLFSSLLLCVIFFLVESHKKMQQIMFFYRYSLLFNKMQCATLRSAESDAYTLTRGSLKVDKSLTKYNQSQLYTST